MSGRGREAGGAWRAGAWRGRLIARLVVNPIGSVELLQLVLRCLELGSHALLPLSMVAQLEVGAHLHRQLLLAVKIRGKSLPLARHLLQATLLLSDRLVRALSRLFLGVLKLCWTKFLDQRL